MKKHSNTSAIPPPPPPPPTGPVTKSGRKMRTGLIAVALIVIILVAVVVLFFFNVIPWPFRSGGTGTVNYGVLMGKVTDPYGNPVSNVTVSVAGQTGTTNAQGWFSIPNIAGGNKLLITFSKNGSATTLSADEYPDWQE